MADPNPDALIAAADAVLGWAERNKAIVQLAEAVKSIGSVKAAKDDADKALAEVTGKLEKAKAELADASEGMTKANSEADRIVEEAHAIAKATAGKAKLDAESAIEKAKASAQAIIDDALAATAKAELEHKGKMEAAEQRLAEMQAQLKAAEITRDGLRDEAQQIEAKITAAKDAARKMLTE